jgi:hypothetical protein
MIDAGYNTGHDRCIHGVAQRGGKIWPSKQSQSSEI